MRGNLFGLNNLIKKVRPKYMNGGDDRDRTCDLLRARQALYQLSYIPIEGLYILGHLPFWGRWWAFLDSNQGPHPYQGCALAS